MGATNMEDLGGLATLDTNAFAVSNAGCLGAAHTAQPPVYSDSGNNERGVAGAGGDGRAHCPRTGRQRRLQRDVVASMKTSPHRACRPTCRGRRRRRRPGHLRRQGWSWSPSPFVGWSPGQTNRALVSVVIVRSTLRVVQVCTTILRWASHPPSFRKGAWWRAHSAESTVGTSSAVGQSRISGAPRHR
jgi:hypothetical protein